MKFPFKPYQFEPLRKCPANVDEDWGTREKLQMLLNIVDALWKGFFEFSKFTEKANKSVK